MNAHELVEATQPFQALHVEHLWEPYVFVGDGYKSMAFKRSDGAGHVVCDPESERWWPSWSHPMLCGRAGWGHAAFGSYGTKELAASAFDKVYDLEMIAGNVDRMTRADADERRRQQDEK